MVYDAHLDCLAGRRDITIHLAFEKNIEVETFN